MNKINSNFFSKIQEQIANNEILKAEQELRKFLKKNSADLQALDFLGQVLTTQKRIDEALVTYKKIIELDSDQYQIWHAIGNLYMSEGKNEKANYYFKQYIDLDPYKKQVIEIENAVNKQSYEQAKILCTKILKLDEYHIISIKILTLIMMKHSDYDKALHLINKGIKFAPFNIDLWYILVDLNALMGRQLQRINSALNTTKLNPDKQKSWLYLASAYAYCGKIEKALLAYQEAERINPKDANIPLQKGHMFKALGKRQQCVEAYRKSISLYTDNGSAFWGLANLKNFEFTNNDLKKLNLLIKSDEVLPDQSVQAKFAIGKAYEDMGKFDLSFQFYQEANNEKSNINFNSGSFEQQCQKLLSGLSKNDFNDNIQPHNVTPIFIVGLPRSGSTLIEQILASHSEIEGTMELQTLPFILGLVNNKAKRQGLNLRDFIKKADQHQLKKIGDKYIQDTEIFRTNKNYFIDKLPSNFLLVDIICKILPNAIIIDARRNPMDNGLSIYKQHFAAGNDFSYSLRHIGLYYKKYLKIMDHWDNILPEKICHIQYEQMVHNTEIEVKKLFKHLKINFEEQCLRFYENKRAVNTASSEQVRQPIYSKGIDYWKNFERHLAPLSDALKLDH